MTTDHNTFDELDAKALDLIGTVFASVDLDQPKVILVALVSMIGSLLAVQAIEDDIAERKLIDEVDALVGDIRQKSIRMHRLLRGKMKQRQQDGDNNKTIH